jgi:hypothetical protein
MIRVTLKVANGPTTRTVTATAPTIEEALAPYQADGTCTASVVFPIDPDGFFVARPADAPNAAAGAAAGAREALAA